MRTGTRNRRAALDGLSRILDAGSPEELFAGGQEEADFLYALLEDTARARASSHYWEICHTARRRGVSPEYVVDRAAILLAAMRERQRSDLYRILGVPPLASAETVRLRWLEVAKRHHPDVGGDGTTFRHVKQAYDVLRDPGRRVEYERFWVRALAPFARVEGVALPAAGDDGAVAGNGDRPEPVADRPVTVEEVAAAGEPDGTSTDSVHAAMHAAARLFAARHAFDRRLDAGGADGGSGVLARIRAALAPIDLQDIERLRADTDCVIAEVEGLRAELARLAAMKRALRA